MSHNIYLIWMNGSLLCVCASSVWCASLIPYIWMSHVLYTSAPVTFFFLYIWMSRVSYIWINHNIYFIYMNKSHMFVCVKWVAWLIDTTYMNESRIMHVWMSHVHFLNESHIMYIIDSQYLFGTYAWVATVCVCINCVAWLIHTIYMNESRIIYINESRIICIWMSHVSYI